MLYQDAALIILRVDTLMFFDAFKRFPIIILMPLPRTQVSLLNLLLHPRPRLEDTFACRVLTELMGLFIEGQ